MINKYSSGGGRNTSNKIKQNPLFKDINDYNKYLLSLVGILFLVVTGVISYNLTNASYAKWSSSVESKNIIKLSVKSGMNATKFATKKVGTEGLEQITHTIDNTLQVDNNFATEYRYRGGDSVVKNYVTFNNEIWRIIGVIPTEDTSGNVENRIKIIRDTSIGNMKWNINGENDWTNARLNTYLNNNYYNTLTSDAKNMIGTTKYYLGGYNDVPSFTSDVMWQYERKNEANRTGYYYGSNPIMQNDVSKKIAIMYASDYGYGASKECTNTLYGYKDSANCKTTNNWLDKSQDTWLLMPFSDYSAGAFEVFMSGSIYIESLFSEAQGHVYPVLSLSSNVKISGGEGTSSSPYTLSVK